MGFQSEIPSKTAHSTTTTTTACQPGKPDEPRNDAPVPDGDFIRAEGTHMKLSHGVPFVLPINGGEVLLHVLEEFKGQPPRDSFPTIVYVEPGPNVSALDDGACFTLFICGRLFLVQVLRVLRRPDSTTRDSAGAVRINLLSPSPATSGAVGPESGNVQFASCTTSERLPPHRLRTAESLVNARCSEGALSPLPPSAQIPDCTAGETPLLMQMPVPSRAIDHELLDLSNYGWPTTSSPIPVTTTDALEPGPPSRAELVTKNFVCPLRTPDTPGQDRSDSLTAQHGSLLGRYTVSSTVDEQIHSKDHEIDHGVQLADVWPSPLSAPFGSKKNLFRSPNSESRLARIIGSSSRFSRPPEPRDKQCSSLRPALDPKVSVTVNDHAAIGSPFPAPIGTGRPHASPVALPPIESLLFAREGGDLPEAFGVQPVCPAAPPSESQHRGKGRSSGGGTCQWHSGPWYHSKFCSTYPCTAVVFPTGKDTGDTFRLFETSDIPIPMFPFSLRY